MATIGKRKLLRDVNPHLICLLCRGYLVDATTVVECLHSFCRSCILKYLSTAAHCPSCKHAINKAKPNIKADKTLQEIVYKLVPGLYHREMLKRREFYRKHPEHVNSATPEQRGEDVSGRLIFNPEDVVSLSLEYLPPGADPLTILSTNDMDANNSNSVNDSNDKNNYNGNIANNRRYLQCPALVTVAHLKKFIAMKYSVDVTRYTIEICHRRATLPENWTLMDVAYIYAWKRIAPMRFFYRVAQEEQRLEAPLHQRPSTPGLGARDCLPPNEARHDNQENKPVNHLETSKVEIKPASDNIETARLKDSAKIANYETISPVECKQPRKVEKDEVKITMATTSTTNTTKVLTTSATSPSPSSGTCSDSSKQIKSPIKILKNSDGRYEVLKSPPAAVADVKSPESTGCPTNPEFSVVNSNGVKLTLKQCSPPQNSAKKPKVISNILLRCGQIEKDAKSGALMIQPDKDKDILATSPMLSGKQDKQRRKVTFVDRSPKSEKASPPGGTCVSVAAPKTALKKPAEQQDKRQFLQGFQLTAREPAISDDGKLKSPVRDISVAMSAMKSFQKSNVIPKMEEVAKKDPGDANKKNNIENTGLNANNTTKSVKCVAGGSANSRACGHKADDADRHAGNSGTSQNSLSIAGGNHAAKADVYTFSSDPPIVPAGAVKRKCPPGVPIADLRRRKAQVGQKQEASKRPNVSSYNSVATKLPRTCTEHAVPLNRPVNITGDHDAGSSRGPKVTSLKGSPGPLLSNDTRDLLVDGYGLNIPASLSITLTSPKSPGTCAQFVEPSDSNDRKATMGKVNPSITLNDRSVDPRVLKALKTGQIRMPTTPSKAKSTGTAAAKQAVPTDHREAANQQRPMGVKRKKEHESSKDVLDLSGGSKKLDIHPLRIPQPVTKLNKTSKAAAGRDHAQPGGISDQGQVVTLMGHKYYRAPPGSLTPAAHRVTDCPLPPSSRPPIYAPSFASLSRPSPDLSSVFPSLPSLYALNPNLQQFQMDAARLRLPPPRATESGAASAIDSGENANSSISGGLGKSHLAAQCAPIKPARSSVAPLAIPIKQPPPEKSANVGVKPAPPAFRNNETFDPADEASHAQKRYSLNLESANRFLSQSECGKTNDQVANDAARDSNAESRNETTDNSAQEGQQQQREATSPNIVSSTASPSPPPNNGGMNARNESNASNDSSGGNNATPRMETPSDQTTSASSEVTCSKPPDSPDSSSITVENSETSKNSTLPKARRPDELPMDAQSSDSARPTNPDNGTKNKFASKSEESEIVKQLTSVQRQWLKVLPSTEWANNPIAAEHLGNFFKSLNATTKNEGFAEEAKQTEQKTRKDDNETR